MQLIVPHYNEAFWNDVCSTNQWCRRRGCRECKRIPRSFDLLKIRAKSVEIWTKSVKTFTNALKIWAESQKIQAKMAPNILRIEKNGTQLAFIEEKWRSTCFNLIKKMASQITWRPSSEIWFLWKNIHTKIGQKFFRASLGKFGQKSFAPPNICLLLHLWYKQ